MTHLCIIVLFYYLLYVYTILYYIQKSCLLSETFAPTEIIVVFQNFFVEFFNKIFANFKFLISIQFKSFIIQYNLFKFIYILQQFMFIDFQDIIAS